MDFNQDHHQPCIVSHFDSASSNLAWADYFDLPPECQAGNTDSALVATEDEEFSPEQISLEEAVNKIIKFRKDGVPSEQDMAHIHVPTNNNKVELLINGHKAFPKIIDAIKEAKDHIHVTYFKFVDDEIGGKFIEALINKAKEGVKVRFMLDEVGSGGMFGGSCEVVIDQLIASGVEVITNPWQFLDFSRESWFFPKDHRKVVIIDGKIGFTGGMNVADSYVFSFHDTMVKMQGHVVHQLQVEWLQSWLNRNGDLDVHIRDEEVIKDKYFPILDNFPGFIRVKVAQGHPGHNDEIRREFIKFIQTAHEKLYLQVPYFSVEDIYLELIAAAERGTDVRLIIPGENNSKLLAELAKSWYPQLLKAGVRVYEHPGFSHLKGAVKDGETVMWGSSNLDGLSLYLNRELNIIVDNSYFAELIEEEIFQKDMEKSTEIKEAKNGWGRWILGGILNMVSDYL